MCILLYLQVYKSKKKTQNGNSVMKNLFAKLKSFFIILAIVFVLSFALIILGGYASTRLVSVLYGVLLFPFGCLSLILNSYLWDYYGRMHWINHEYMELTFFFVALIGQTFVYYYIYKFVKARKKRKMEIQL